MATSYGSYDIEDASATQDLDSLGLAILEHTMPKGDNESSDV